MRSAVKVFSLLYRAKAAEIQKQLPNMKIELTDMRDRMALDRLVSNYPHVNMLINNVGIKSNYNFAVPAMLFDRNKRSLPNVNNCSRIESFVLMAVRSSLDNEPIRVKYP
jgi:short-subunit dehydrogenase involved in D-alanine esterification of teichoic acids